MAFKLVCLLATLAVVNAGYIASPAYSDDHHHAYVAPVAKLAYSPAPSVSHVYSSMPVQQAQVKYVAPAVQKTLTYAAPIGKSSDEIGHGLSTYYSPAAVHKPVYADSGLSHYSTENHYHSAPSHTLAYAPVAKSVEYAPVAKTISYAPVAKTIQYAPAVYESHEAPVYGHTHESIHRSHDGTVSHYGKTIATPHSHVEKYDTRVNNQHYKLAAVPAVQYQAAPVVQKVVAPVVQKYAVPAAVKYTSAPAVQHYTPAVQHYTPAVQHYTPAVQQYAHAAPVVAQKTVSYSPAEAVAHATFESSDVHYSW